jgi:CRP/FNR family transcriptional regulator
MGAPRLAHRGTAVGGAMNVVAFYRHGARHPQAQVCAACEVRQSALFGALDNDGLDRIHTRIEGLSIPADGLVHARGRAGEAVFTVRSGLVRFERYNERGDRRIVRLAGRGDLIGQEALMRRPCLDEAIACTPVELCRIPRSLIDELGHQGGALPLELLQRLQGALEQAEAWAAELCAGSARRRLLRLLLRLADHADAQGTIWLPRRDEMGAMLDMTIETASRLVSSLRREGILHEVTLARTARLNVPALHLALKVIDAG